MDKLKNKKILFVIDNLSFGGAQKLVLDQINLLNKEKYNVNLLTLIPNNRSSFMDRLVISTQNIFFLDSRFNLKSIFKIYNFLKKNEFEIIISNLYFSNTLIRFASLFLLKKPKIIIYEHNVYAKEKKFKNLLIDKFLSYFTLKIIAVSEEVKSYLISQGIDNKKIDFIKNGIDFPRINVTNLGDVRNELGVNNQQKLVVSVGNVDFQKGHDLLIEAANLINLKGNKNFIYIICGRLNNKEYIASLEKKINEYGLQNNFKLMGDRSDVLEIVNAADIFVMPSRWEGLSIALLEAMSLKKPILVSDIESMTKIIEDKKTGLLFQTENYNDLTDKLLSLSHDDELQKQIGEAALVAVQEYSIDNNVKNLFNSILFSLEENSKTYNLADQKSEKWFGRAKAAVSFLSGIKFNKEKPIIVGDFGCGNKKIFEILQQEKEMNFAYFGYDILPQSEDVTKINFSKEFPDKNFDVVFVMGMIEYLEDLGFFFKNLSEKCDYVIMSCIISDANKYSKKDATNNGWVNFMSSNDLVNLIHENNFDIVESKVMDAGVTYLAVIKNKKNK